MGVKFFATGQKSAVNAKRTPSNDLLHKLGCRACTLNKVRSIRSPKMEASGSEKPLIYILGEGPGENEDDEGEQFVGRSGEFLRPKFPRAIRKDLRFNNVINCWSGRGNPTPDSHQIECCRGRIEEDIERTRPLAIFGMGFVPLSWAGKTGGISLWGGRRFPIRVGAHVCWYYAFPHPAYLLRIRKNRRTTDDEEAFNFWLKKAITEVLSGNLPVPTVHDVVYARKDITCITGRHGSKDLAYVLDFLDYAGTKDVAGVDYETQNLRPYIKGDLRSRIVTMSASVSDETLAFAYDHPEAGWTEDQREQVKQAWVKFLQTECLKAVHNCFSGDTQILTRDGIVDFKSVAGKTVSVWDGSQWVYAEAVNFGKQKLWNISFVPYNRSRSLVKHDVKVTPNHNWLVQRKYKTTGIWKTLPGFTKTRDLKEGDRVSFKAPLSEPDRYSSAFIHGLIFADGALCTGQNQRPEKGIAHQIRLCGWKSKYSDCFPKINYPPSANGDPVCNRYYSDLNLKELPPEGSSAEYIRDFIEGWQVLDGSRGTDDFSRRVFTVKKSFADWLIENASLGGWAVTGYREHTYKGFNDLEKPCWTVNITKDPQMAWVVREVTPADKEEDVFCVEVPTNHCFTLGPGIYTGNSSFEMEWSAFFFGNELCRSVPWRDTQTGAYVLDERVGDRKPGALSLEFLTSQHYGINIKQITRGLDKTRMINEPLSAILPYNGIDSKYHRLVFYKQDERIDAEKLRIVYEEKERQIPTVVLTQLKGIKIDRKANKELSDEYGPKIENCLRRIAETQEAKDFRRLKHIDYDPARSQHVQILLRELIKTREGQDDEDGDGWSTTASVLKKVGSPLCTLTVEYRNLTKIKSTYVDPVAEGSPILYEGGVIHTSLGTTFTETGRLNSEEPNIQNWPIRSAEGKKARRQVKSKIVASFDYGQIDARLIACCSRDRAYCKALWEDFDIHLDWAHKLSKRHPEFLKPFLIDKDPIKKFRGDKVKNQWVFALFYGAALRTTAGRFDTEEGILRPDYDEFWDIFSGVKDWQGTLEQQIDNFGYVQLNEGQRRRMPLSRGQVINTGIQNGTNRVVMSAMNRLSELGDPVTNPKIKHYDPSLQANMQIHDDLTFCFESEQQFEDYTPRILDIMLDGSEFDWICVPLSVEIKCGPTWADMEEIAAFNSVERIGWPIREKIFT